MKNKLLDLIGCEECAVPDLHLTGLTDSILKKLFLHMCLIYLCVYFNESAKKKLPNSVDIAILGNKRIYY